VLKKGETLILPSLAYWMVPPSNVEPILFHRNVEERMAADTNGDGCVILVRLHTTDRPDCAPAHLRPTTTDVIFPRNTCPIFYSFQRSPLTLPHASAPREFKYADRIRTSKPTDRTATEREMQYGASLNSRTYKATAAAQLSWYQKDSTESYWTYCTNDDEKETPVMSRDERVEWKEERSLKQRRSLERAVETRGRVNDPRDKEASENDYRTLIDRRITLLTTRPKLQIFDITALDEKRLAWTKKQEKKNKQQKQKNKGKANQVNKPPATKKPTSGQKRGRAGASDRRPLPPSSSREVRRRCRRWRRRRRRRSSGAIRPRSRSVTTSFLPSPQTSPTSTKLSSSSDGRVRHRGIPVTLPTWLELHTTPTH